MRLDHLLSKDVNVEIKWTLTFCSVLREHVYVLFNKFVLCLSLLANSRRLIPRHKAARKQAQVVALRLRLQEDSEKLDSSTQGSEEADSRQ